MGFVAPIWRVHVAIPPCGSHGPQASPMAVQAWNATGSGAAAMVGGRDRRDRLRQGRRGISGMVVSSSRGPHRPGAAPSHRRHGIGSRSRCLRRSRSPPDGRSAIAGWPGRSARSPPAARSRGRARRLEHVARHAPGGVGGSARAEPLDEARRTRRPALPVADVRELRRGLGGLRARGVRRTVARREHRARRRKNELHDRGARRLQPSSRAARPHRAACASRRPAAP
jgi:hypothetical protein